MTTPAPPSIRVALVDDDPLALEALQLYLARIEGFTVVAECASARLALQRILAPETRPDLVLLDVTMPDGTGLEVLRRIRARGAHCDVIAVSGVRDAEVVREMVSLGAVQYLIKPYTFGAFRERLESYRDYFRQARRHAGPSTQYEVDALFATLRPPAETVQPKGIAGETLEQVVSFVRGTRCTASELADRLGLSREVSRRYLEHLATARLVDRWPLYGARGRPQIEYRWREGEAREGEAREGEAR